MPHPVNKIGHDTSVIFFMDRIAVTAQDIRRLVKKVDAPHRIIQKFVDDDIFLFTARLLLLHDMVLVDFSKLTVEESGSADMLDIFDIEVDTAEELFVGEGLFDVVVGPELEKSRGDPLLLICRQDDDRHRIFFKSSAERFSKSQAVHFRHIVIGQDHFDIGVGFKDAQPLFPVRRGMDIKKMKLQETLDIRTERFGIVDNQDLDFPVFMDTAKKVDGIRDILVALFDNIVNDILG